MWGCGSGSKAGAGVPGQASFPGPATSPGSPTAQTLAILKDGKQLKVGDSASEAGLIFPQPQAQHVYKLSTLPASLKGFGYSVVGWESGSLGFGAIISGDKIVAALYTEKQDSKQRTDGIIGNYTQTFVIPPTHLTAPGLNYYFWQSGSDRLMLLDQKIDRNSHRVTIAVGENPVMDQLRADPAHVRTDLAQLKSLK